MSKQLMHSLSSSDNGYWKLSKVNLSISVWIISQSWKRNALQAFSLIPGGAGVYKSWRPNLLPIIHFKKLNQFFVIHGAKIR